MAYNEKSRLNLQPGSTKTKFKVKKFRLSKTACEWLERHKNQTQAIEDLIAEKLLAEK